MDTKFTIENIFLKDELACEQSQYPQYVANLQNGLFALNGLGDILPNLEKMIKVDAYSTILLLEDMSKIIKKVKNDDTLRVDSTTLVSKSWANYSSGFSKYIKVIKQEYKNQVGEKKKWKKKYGEIAEQVNLLATRIDGTDSLLKAIGKDKWTFIKLVLCNSYFFDPKVVKEQHGAILKKIKNKEKLPARWTEWYNSKKDSTAPFQDLTKDEIKKKSGETIEVKYENISVEIDSDGNYAVKQLIKDKFGYKVSWGKDSNIQFYKISHIWGEAYDPRKFTNLWNLVLVPAWANDLLDKTYSKDELTVTFKQVIKAVCLKFYKMEELSWEDLMEMPSYKAEHEDDMLVDSQNNRSFEILWIEKLCGKDEFGKIHKKTVNI